MLYDNADDLQSDQEYLDRPDPREALLREGVDSDDFKEEDEFEDEEDFCPECGELLEDCSCTPDPVPPAEKDSGD